MQLKMNLQTLKCSRKIFFDRRYILYIHFVLERYNIDSKKFHRKVRTPALNGKKLDR